MSLEIERQAERARSLLNKPEVTEAMAIRCAEEGRHDWENCMTAFLQVFQECKWCGERRRA